jgi:hypothetical protein
LLGACGASAGDGAGNNATETDGGSDPIGNGDQLPRISSDMLVTDEDVALRFTVTVSDLAGGPLTITAGAPEHGTAAASGLSVEYSPAANYSGGDAFVVTASVGERSASARVDVIVVPVNDPPVAADDAFAAQPNTPLVLAHATLLGNDRDVDGDTLTVKSVSGATHGTVVSADGEITFTPDRDFAGAASYRYTITDGSAEATATVTISVSGSNQRPFATNDTATTAEDEVLEIAAADLLANDIDDGPLTMIGVVTAISGHGSAAFGGGAVRFTPEPNYHGPAFFTYIVTDGIAFATAFVDVTVTAVNDAPTTSADIVETTEDTTLVFPATDLLANDVDPDDPTDHQPLTLTSVGDASHGSVALTRGTITFVPEPNYNGAASFTYAVSDGIATATGVVTVNVRAINDAPVAGDDTAGTTTEDTPIAIPVADLLANDRDVDVATNGQVLRVTGFSSSPHTVVLADGVVTFTPSRNFNGTAIFTYAVSDGILSATGRVTVLVTPVNDPPTSPNRIFSAIEDSGISIGMGNFLLQASDPENDVITFAGFRATPETHGTLVISGVFVSYTPDPDFNGQAQFEFLLSDGSLIGSALAIVNVEARPGAGPRTSRSR